MFFGVGNYFTTRSCSYLENDARRITASSCSCYYALFRGSPVTLREKRSTRITRNNTNEGPWQIRGLTQSLPTTSRDTDPVTSAHRKRCNRNKILRTCCAQETQRKPLRSLSQHLKYPESFTPRRRVHSAASAATKSYAPRTHTKHHELYFVLV